MKLQELKSADFDSLLIDCINNESGSELLQIPGVYEILSEHFNNQIIEMWEGADNPGDLNLMA